MKGADQCPRCGSRKHGDASVAAVKQKFYAETLRVCANCGTAWEPFEASALLDPEPHSSFVDPCDNCAFRKGSPEQSDPERWKEIMGAIGWDGAFYCHKGVPIDLKGEDGFAYPKKAAPMASAIAGQEVRVHDIKKMRLCRGYLNHLNSKAWP